MRQSYVAGAVPPLDTPKTAQMAHFHLQNISAKEERGVKGLRLGGAWRPAWPWSGDL